MEVWNKVKVVSIKIYTLLHVPLHPVLWSQSGCKQLHLFWQKCPKAGYLHPIEQFKPMYPNGQTVKNMYINNTHFNYKC